MRDNRVPNFPNRAGSGRRSGFSLIEILVALIILLIGIFAIVRLFPPGFLTISRTGEISQAQALAQQQLDSIRNAYSPPFGIYAINPTTGLPDPNIGPDDLTDRTAGDPYLNGKDPYFFSNINPIRHIEGDAFPVPVSSNTGSGYGAIHALQFGPVENVLTPGAPNTDSIVVSGAPLERIEQTSAKTVDNPTGLAILSNESQYAIDYDNGLVAFYPRLKAGRAVPSRQFVLSFDYYVNNGGVVNISYQPKQTVPAVMSTVITIPDVDPDPSGNVPPPVWIHFFQNAADPAGYSGMTWAIPLNFLGLRRGGEDVSRQFRLVSGMAVEDGGVPAWTAGEPYEYAWYSKQLASNTVNAGVLIFNPSGHNQIANLSTGAQALIARVDYNIYDNHIIREDRNLPDNGPYAISLTLPFLQLTGDVLDNQLVYNSISPNPYNGMFRVAGTNTPDILLYNVGTGDEVAEFVFDSVAQQFKTVLGAKYTDQDAPNPFLSVDQKTGILTFDTKDIEGNGLKGASLRIYYRAQKDWGMQVQKATTHYIEASSAATIDVHSYWIGDGTGGSSPTRIYFPKCDAGKTVTVGEYYYNFTPGDPSDAQQPKHAESYQITNDINLLDAVGLPFIDITSQHKNATGFSATQTGRRVDNVQGVSLKSKIVWHSGQRWRHLETDTLLAPPPIH